MQQHHSHAVCYYKYYAAMQIFRLRLLCVWMYSWASLQKCCWRGWTTTIQPDEDQRSQNPLHNMLAKSSEVIILSDSSFEEFQQVLKREKIIYIQFTQKCVGWSRSVMHFSLCWQIAETLWYNEVGVFMVNVLCYILLTINKPLSVPMTGWCHMINHCCGLCCLYKKRETWIKCWKCDIIISFWPKQHSCCKNG